MSWAASLKGLVLFKAFGSLFRWRQSGIAIMNLLGITPPMNQYAQGSGVVEDPDLEAEDDAYLRAAAADMINKCRKAVEDAGSYCKIIGKQSRRSGSAVGYDTEKLLCFWDCMIQHMPSLLPNWTQPLCLHSFIDLTLSRLGWVERNHVSNLMTIGLRNFYARLLHVNLMQERIKRNWTC